MKTFSKFLEMKEKGLDVSLPNYSDGESESLQKALEKALENHRDAVKSFLERLAKQDPDIQIELDKANHSSINSPKRKISFSPEGRGDVVIPNAADSMGDLE